jgi:hypothetical protein
MPANPARPVLGDHLWRPDAARLYGVLRWHGGYCCWSP